jgi:hypothetical protein
MTTFTTQDRQDAERDDVAKKALENFKPQWQDVQRTPLTDEQLGKLALSSGAWQSPKSGTIYPDDMDFIEFARAIERAHGIGE